MGGGGGVKPNSLKGFSSITFEKISEKHQTLHNSTLTLPLPMEGGGG